MKIRLTRIFPFEMAHALYGYDGPCKNIHGHSYRLEVTVQGPVRKEPGHPKDGMLLDFGDLKKIVNEQIIDNFDHALVLNGESPHREIPDLNEHFEKVVFVDFQPTCENLLLDYRERLLRHLPEGISLVRLRLHETASACAEWDINDQP